jgi:hypothetical protein
VSYWKPWILVREASAKCNEGIILVNGVCNGSQGIDTKTELAVAQKAQKKRRDGLLNTMHSEINLSKKCVIKAAELTILKIAHWLTSSPIPTSL